jgi:predicted metal-dependent enzyme (double-stranded beta helix superfamily)
MTNGKTTVEDLARAVEEVLAQHSDEPSITQAVADHLRDALARGLELDERVLKPGADHYVMYPLWVDEGKRFSIASAVWGIGQQTPVHDHGTWGVVGIYSGFEREESYTNPELTGDTLPSYLGAEVWKPGEVTVCCTTDADVHRVSSDGDVPCVGIHIYGDDIGVLPRRSFNKDTGAVSYFTSTWTAVEPASTDASN